MLRTQGCHGRRVREQGPVYAGRRFGCHCWLFTAPLLEDHLPLCLQVQIQLLFYLELSMGPEILL